MKGKMSTEYHTNVLSRYTQISFRAERRYTLTGSRVSGSNNELLSKQEVASQPLPRGLLFLIPGEYQVSRVVFEFKSVLFRIQTKGYRFTTLGTTIHTWLFCHRGTSVNENEPLFVLKEQMLRGCWAQWLDRQTKAEK